MFDKDTLIIGYDEKRGEPRGKHKKGDEWLNHGHCIDCTACVQVCPMGIDIGITIAGIMSLYETARHGEHAYFDSAVMLIFFLLIGRYLDFRARKSARSTATDLLSSLSGFAMISEDGKLRRIAIRDLEEGHLVLVAAGEKIPADGIVLNGQGEVDTALVTGETLPRQIGPGDALYSGTINLAAPLQIKVVKKAENSLLADIVRLMEKAEQGQARYVRIADRAAKLYTPVVHSCALLSFLYWFFIGGMAWEQALMIAVTVLIITCPCALGLAVPVAQVLATGRLLRRGILVKAGDALERLAEIDTVLLDKTGTLTQGCLTLEGVYEPSALHLAASLAHHSLHPLSQAIAKTCAIEPLPLTDVCEYAGRGIAGLYDGRVVRLGSRDWCGNADTLPTGKTELWLDDGAGKCTVFYFTDILREDSPQTITRLKMAGLYPAILSGDRIEIVEQVARQCGIEEYYAGLLPTDKFERLESLKKQNHKILMVGDGLNDAPALADAHVSMAPGTAIDMAQNAADIVFMGGKLSPVYEAYATARMAQKIVKQNFTLAVVYNLFAIPLAIGGFVTPFVAALAMSGSSVIVIVNSFRLRWNA